MQQAPMISDRDRILAQIAAWRDELIMMSRRNRLIYFQHTKTSTLEFIHPDAASLLIRLGSTKPSLGFFEHDETEQEGQLVLAPDASASGVAAFRQGTPMEDELVAQVVSTSGTPHRLIPASRARLRATLNNLDRQTRQEFLDKGLQSLYLTIGVLTWKETEDSDSDEAPLLLVPVELQREGPRDPFRLFRLTNEDTVVNPALALKLERDFGIELPAVDESGEIDVAAFLKDVVSATAGQTSWKVEPRVILGRFSFHKDVMYRDLLENEGLIAESAIIRALTDGVGSKPNLDFDAAADRDLDRIAPQEELFSIRDADASQRKCIIAARDGKSFVMDGPPGTGKSQTIANIIAELMAQGRSVLFVSEKAAALEVVYDRLAQSGLDAFVLQLHSHKATRREVASELGKCLAARPCMKGTTDPQSGDALRKRRAALNAHALAMNETREPLGRSLFWVIGRVSQLADIPGSSAPVTVGDLGPAKLGRILDAAERLGRAWGPVDRGDDFLWRDVTRSGLDSSTKTAIETALCRLLELVDQIAAETASISESLRTTAPRGLVEAAWLSGLVHLLKGRVEVPVDWLTTQDFDGRVRAIDELQMHCAHFARALADYSAETGSAEGLQDVVALDQLLSRAMARLDEGLLVFVPKPELTRLEVRRYLERVETVMAGLGSDFVARSDRLFSALGLDAVPRTVGALRGVVRLLEMAESPDRPEAEWLDAGQLPQVVNAQDALRAIVTQYSSLNASVQEVFTDGVLDLPLEDLCTRFGSVHQGLGKLRPAYWHDRKLLIQCARAGKVTPAVLDSLHGALELQRLSVTMGRVEERHAATLGTYYEGAGTDFERLNRAVGLAQKALELVSVQLELGDILPRLAHDSQERSETLLLARSLRESLQCLYDYCDSESGVLPDPSGTDIGSLLRALDDVQSGLGTIETAFAQAESVGYCPLALSDMQRGIALATSVLDVRALLAREEPRLSEMIGERYQGFDTDIAALRAAASWTLEVRGHFKGEISKETSAAIMTSDVTPDEIDRLLLEWNDAFGAAVGIMSHARQAEIATLVADDFQIARGFVGRLRDSLGDVDEWLAFAAARNDLVLLGLEQLADFAVMQRCAADAVRPIVERRVLESWIDEVIRQDSERIGSTRSADQNALVEEFASLDRALARSAAANLMRLCNERRPTKLIGDSSLIMREAAKKKRHMPIRDLLKRTRETSQALKPCFMMSPLSVSQFLDSSFTFDAVVFDEASQIRPHDAINCLYRGQQHIVAGDEHQLPPTSFFETQSDDSEEWVEDQIEQYESVLDRVKASGCMPSMPLLWHYRSQHEDLITFSNYSFYDGRLVTFPSPSDSGDLLGVGYHYVDGVYRRGAQRDNREEARKVAELVAHYAKQHPSVTLGVVAFSHAQEAAIVSAIEELKATDPSLPSEYFSAERLKGFFVKNLETVQGDERDVIILSIGYGPDENKKTTMSFGPINRAGGYRRLNVAVTRARRRLELVTSLRSSHFAGGSQNEGVRHLGRYIDYAERGPAALALDVDCDHDFDSPFESEVARVIGSWGYDVVPQVGSAGYRIDLGVRDAVAPSGFALGIECDGAAYHSSKVARDRDRLREEVLKGLGWDIYRIWGPSWYRQRPEEEAKLKSAIELAVSGARGLKVLDVHIESPPLIIEETVALDDHLADCEWVEPYAVSVATITPIDRRTPLGSPASPPILWGLITEIVRDEGPVDKAIVLDRVKSAWRVERAGARIQESFEMAVGDLASRGVLLVDGDGFINIIGVGDRAKVRIPVDGNTATARTSLQVPREELVLAVRQVASMSPGIGKAELSIRIARLFGWSRRGPDIAIRLDEAIIDSGVILADDTVDAPPLRPRVSKPRRRTQAAAIPWAGSTKSDRCSICGFLFEGTGQVFPVRFIDGGGQRNLHAHMGCLAGAEAGQQTVPGYRWDKGEAAFYSP